MTRPCLIALFIAAISVARATADDGATFFAEQVHPLLEANCYRCHGGEDKLKGGFRITSREGLLRGGDYGPGYDAENPAGSLLLEMVSYSDDDHQMPPKEKLGEADLAILTKWVEMGVPYDSELEIIGDPSEGNSGFTITEENRNYWAYRPIEGGDPPQVKDPAWRKNPVDAFIFSKLDEANLQPNGPASARSLMRRVTYDLTGLPPNPQDVTAFEKAFADNPDAAYEGLIEYLLDQDAYGEKWARHWLDLVRYAESNGFERDNPKPHIWRYRDYVIDAFNEDKPYDQFVIEQIAGDEIENPTMASLAATGFHRLMQWDDEPADRKQHVYDVLADNVQMASETFLGTTMGCARCHDHKADPISQKDYYSFMAFFHGLTPYATGGTIRPWASPEKLAEFEKERQVRVKSEEDKLAAIEADLTAFLKREGKLQPKGSVKVPIKTFVDDARGTPATWSYTTKAPAPGWKEVGQNVKDWLKAQGGFGTRGTPNSNVTTEWTTPEIWMRTNFGHNAIPDQLVLEIYHDEDVEVYLNGALIFEAKGYITDYQIVELGQEALDVFQTGKNVLAVHCKQTGGGQFIDLALRTGAQKPNSLPEALRRGGKKLTEALKKEFGRDMVKDWNETKNKINQVRREMPGTPLNVVQESGPNPQPLNVHLRGSAHAPGDPVVPAFPAVLSSDSSAPEPAVFEPIEKNGTTTSGRRLALAKWLVDPSNPLTSRVIMNRLWQHHFGRGIVTSSSDFGKLGETPTHPELLNWLAAELIRKGWSLKEMHRLILTSKTYRMSSEPDSANLAADPTNRLFWRHDMRRLTAEELRDSILAVSGNLNLDTGGEWVFPPLPAEVLATASRPGKGWPISKDPKDHFRRSVYIHVKRSLRHQMLADFDQADTDSPCAVRFATTVPTQALAMLNSKFVNDQAADLAKRLREKGGSIEDQIRRGLEMAIQRPAEDREVQHCLELVEKMKTESGLSEDEALDRFALLALNLNEFVYLD